MKANPASKPEEGARRANPTVGARAARPPELRQGLAHAGEAARAPYSLSVMPDFPPGCRGWVFYDALCPLCLSLLAQVGSVFRRRGFEFVPLQEPRAATTLGVSEAELHREMKLRLADGRIVGGVDAWCAMGRAVWWLWPAAFFLSLPGISLLAKAAYRWLAGNRYCLSGVCGLPDVHQRRVHHAATTFLELP